MNTPLRQAVSVAAAALLLTASGLDPTARAEPTTRPTTAPSTASSTAPATAPAADLSPLLDGLDADAYADREGAEAALVAALVAEPSLRDAVSDAAEADARPEVRARARTALARFDDQRQFGTTRLTLHQSGVSGRELCDAFAKAAGVSLDFWPRDPFDPQQGGQRVEGVSLDLDAAAFWPAVAELCAATNLGLADRNPGPAAPGQPPADLTLVARGNGGGGGGGDAFDPQAPTCVPDDAGAFTVQLRGLQLNRNESLVYAVGPDGKIEARPSVSQSMVISLAVLVEPKVRLAAPLTGPILSQVLDDRGTDLMPPASRRNAGSVYANGSAWSYRSQCVLDAGDAAGARRIAVLAGRFDAEVATEVARLDVPVGRPQAKAGAGATPNAPDAPAADDGDKEVAPPAEVGRGYDVGPYRIAVEALTRNDDGTLELGLGVSGGDVGERASSNRWSFGRGATGEAALRVYDETGAPWQQQGYNTRFDNGTLRLTCRLRPPREGARAARLTWELPVRTRVVPVEFEFRDVPLPDGN